MTSEKFNAVGGLSVSIPPIDIISSSGNITAPYANIGNIVAGQGVFGNLTVSGNIVGNVIGNIIGNITGNIRVPGADTQILFNIGGNVSTSANFTFNPVTSFLNVTGNVCVTETLCANYLHGDGSNITNVHAMTANTVTNGLQPNITQLPNIQTISIANAANFAHVSVVHIPGGNAGEVLTTDGNGNLHWAGGTNEIANGLSSIVIPTVNGPINFNTATATPAMTIGTAGNITIETELWVDGNVRAGVFDGNGSRLFDIPAANIVGSIPSALVANYANFAGQANAANSALVSVTANFANYAGNVTVSNQPNITQVGTLVAANVAGNLVAANIRSNNLLTINSTVMGVSSVGTNAITPVPLFTYPATMSAAEFTVTGRNTATSAREMVRLNVATDGAGASVSEWGRVGTGPTLGSQTVTVNGGNLEIWVTPATANPVTWTVNYTLT